MDDSELDFVDLCSKLLKRVRKKPSQPKQPRQPKKAEHVSSIQPSDGDKRRRNPKKDGGSGSQGAGSQSVCAGQRAACGGSGSGDAGSSAQPRVDGGLKAKDKVLNKMQQFKRASPQKMVHKDKSLMTNQESNCVAPPVVQKQDTAECFSSGLQQQHTQDSDEALALRLQQELDREAVVQTADLQDGDGGLLFCHICHRDLAHMTPTGRMQHLNRCLDESEESAPAPPPPPPPPGVPDCPICGKKFKSQKSRSAHLKRCSSDMGVAPAVLLQALQRQTEENQNAPTANGVTETGGTKKRKGPSKPGLPARKKPRKTAEPLDEDTMVALALSSSLLQQERQSERLLDTEAAASRVSMTSVLKWRPDAGKGRGKKRKGAVPRPPPLLLIQDPEVALTRLQERVSALLLRSRAPSPPTPTRCPSSLPGWSGAAPLWQKSSLLDGGSTRLSDFYTLELKEFITPLEPTDADSPSTTYRPESSVTGNGASIPPTSQTAPSPPGTGRLPVASQALRDLVELAEDGFTLTQCDYTAPPTDKEKSGSLTADLHQSGFVSEEEEEQADLCLSGFLPETTPSGDTHSRERRATDRSGAATERGGRRSVALSRLASDLSSMVNNPQFSDVQLQVDSGEVFFAHSFMVYARCPLLVEMVHESGFGVQEEGMPAAQRVLLSDVPAQAVFALLQYVYTAHCSVPASLRPHVLELASRFDLQDLQQLCELCQEDAAPEGEEEAQQENADNLTDQAFVGLLRSMWNEEDEEGGGGDAEGESNEERGIEGDRQADDLTAGDREIRDENVNEEELEEIYEFAATQRKREEKDSIEEEDEEGEENIDEGDDGGEVTKVTEPKMSSTDLQPDPSLDRSYGRLFSDSCGVYEEVDPSSSPSTSVQSKTHTPRSQKYHSPPKKLSPKLSGRTLLQSSESAVDDLSLSPPSSSSNLPVAGRSPRPEQTLPFKRESQGPRSICVPLSPESPQGEKGPELIVLSDSSDEMEVVLSSRSPSPLPPRAALQSYTQIKPQTDLRPNEPALQDKSPDDRPASPVDCSPEVSWLIPSTPLQHSTTSSTQTRNSMCRTQLFPKGPASSPSRFPSDLPSNSGLQTTNSPTRESAHIDLTGGAVPGMDLEERVPHNFRFDLSPCAKGARSCDKSEVFAVPLIQPKHSHASKQDTPLHLPPQPYSSSTPLHTELHQPSAPPFSSPLHSDKQRSPRQDGDRLPFVSPEKTELQSFHLSPLSNPSGSPSSFSHRGLQSPQRRSESSHRSPASVEFSSGDITGRRARHEEGERECENKDTADGVDQEEAAGETGSRESSRQHSFMAMDEPPMAFNDSWGLDVCVDANPACFSLRLEASGGSSQQENSPRRPQTASSSSSIGCQPSSSTSPVTHSAPEPTRTTPVHSNSLLDSKIWDSWEEEEEEDEALPLSQRVNPSVRLRTPAASRNKKRRTLVPITPMPHYSDMDTPDLKNKLNRFGVRPLPKRQMILKLKQIHQYTHQLLSSDSEDEAPSACRTAQTKPPPSNSVAAGSGQLSCVQPGKFKEPRAPTAFSPLKHNREEEAELLSASQGSNTSSTAASEESERSNPELCPSSDGNSDSDGGISASQSATRLHDRLRAVRAFILSDSELYAQILQYQPLVLSQLQARLKAAGIRLGAAKLVDYLDSQCITFTTAKPGVAPSRRRPKKPKAAGGSGASRKRAV